MTEATRQKVYEVIFGTDTLAGRRFDLILIACILLSVSVVIIDSVGAIHDRYGPWLYAAEWFFTILFTIEYGLRLYSSPRPVHYAKSFFGIVDLLAILPTYIAILVPGGTYLMAFRLLRVLRIFRILKLIRYLSEANILLRAFVSARRKIYLFFFSVIVLVVVFGSLMYVIEGPENGFTSIPQSIYWAIVTITTVGYGDIIPQTIIGRGIASLAMVTGYAIIAVPTGIFSAEMMSEIQRERSLKRCQNCERAGHETDAEFCKYCGVELP